MAADDTHALGYRRVDDDPNVSVLLANMGVTATWEATRTLRTWERERLQLRTGQRLLDVGCGRGEAALALAADLGGDGEVIGVDASGEMLRIAEANFATARCRSRFAVADALSLDEPDGSFDAVRSERMLQWVADPGAAVDEMARVLRSGGRLALTDTDWSTFSLDIGDEDLNARVRTAMRDERGRPSNVGRRLGELVAAAGLNVVDATQATQTWTEWNPDKSSAPDGCFSMASLADDLIERGQLSPASKDAFVATVHDAARNGRFAMSLTMHAVVAQR